MKRNFCFGLAFLGCCMCTQLKMELNNLIYKTCNEIYETGEETNYAEYMRLHGELSAYHRILDFMERPPKEVE